MNKYNASENQTTRRILLIACVTVLVVAFTVSLLQRAHADTVTPPPNIQVPAGNKLFLVGHAKGTQNYICLPSGSSFAWTLFTPEATLFGEDGGQVTTHFFSPNPFEPNTNQKVASLIGTIRATWQHRDTSTVWAKLHQNPDGTTGSVTVDRKAIAWLLLDAVGARNGPTGGDVLTKTAFIQRLNTTGGLANPADCASSGDVGKQAFIPYTADYLFYQKAD
jgi:hypothetical protein